MGTLTPEPFLSCFCKMEQVCLYTNGADQTQSAGDNSFSVIKFRGADTQYVAVCKENETYFAGHTTKGILSSWIMGEIPQRFIDLVVNAINNRTRERNFSRLGEQLASGEITEEEYERALDENEDDYVIKCDVKPSEMDIKMAASLAPKIMDLEDTDDLAVLFSFDESEIRHYLEG